MWGATIRKRVFSRGQIATQLEKVIDRILKKYFKFKIKLK